MNGTRFPFQTHMAYPIVGFTAPTDIYNKMRTVDLAADSLNQDIVLNVANSGTSGTYKAAWNAWFQHWKQFFSANYQKVGTLLHTDELDRQVDQEHAIFLGFKKDYPNQLRPDGRPVPSPSTPNPVQPPPGQKSESGVPWWVWVLGGAALVGVGYLGYMKYKELSAKRKAIEEGVLPALFGAEFGPKTGHALAKAAAARDPRQRTALDSLGLYAGSPEPMRERIIVYRPYEHPHLVNPQAAGRRLQGGASPRQAPAKRDPVIFGYDGGEEEEEWEETWNDEDDWGMEDE